MIFRPKKTKKKITSNENASHIYELHASYVELELKKIKKKKKR